jgi:hypothetical protein
MPNVTRRTTKRWSWWDQVRDVAATVAGLGLLTVESVRGTYNPIAMTFAAVCLGIVGSGVLGRYLVGRWEDEDETKK